MSDFNPDIEFLGLRVPAGKPLAIPKFVPEDDQSGITHRPHITGVALGPSLVDTLCLRVVTAWRL